MLKKGALRVLKKGDPDPFPDAIIVNAEAPADKDGESVKLIRGEYKQNKNSMFKK